MSETSEKARGGKGPAAAPVAEPPKAETPKVHKHERKGYMKFRIWNEETPPHLRDIDVYPSTFDGRKEDLVNGRWNVLPAGFYSNVADSVIVVQKQNEAPASEPEVGQPYDATTGGRVSRFRIDVEVPTKEELEAAIAKYGVRG